MKVFPLKKIDVRKDGVAELTFFIHGLISSLKQINKEFFFNYLCIWLFCFIRLGGNVLRFIFRKYFKGRFIYKGIVLDMFRGVYVR